MNLSAIHLIAERDGKTKRELTPEELIQQGDFLEWLPNVFTTIDQGSSLVGKRKEAVGEKHIIRLQSVPTSDSIGT